MPSREDMDEQKDMTRGDAASAAPKVVIDTKPFGPSGNIVKKKANTSKKIKKLRKELQETAVGNGPTD
jgi:hypothetical protein